MKFVIFILIYFAKLLDLNLGRLQKRGFMRHGYGAELMQVMSPLVKKWLVLESMLGRQIQVNTFLSSHHNGIGSNNIDNDDRIIEILRIELLSGITDLVHDVDEVLNSPIIASSLVLTQEVLARTSTVLANREQYSQQQGIDLSNVLDAMIYVNENILESQSAIDSLNRALADGLAFPLVDIELLRGVLIDILETAEPYTSVVDTFPRPNQNDTLPEPMEVHANWGALQVCLLPTTNSELAGNVFNFIGNLHPRNARLHDNQEDEMAYAAVANVGGFCAPISPISQAESVLSNLALSEDRESYTVVNESFTPPVELGAPNLPPLEAVLALDVTGEACFSYL